MLAANRQAIPYIDTTTGDCDFVSVVGNLWLAALFEAPWMRSTLKLYWARPNEAESSVQACMSADNHRLSIYLLHVTIRPLDHLQLLSIRRDPWGKQHLSASL